MSVFRLDALFAPASVAVVGASLRPGRVGTVVMRNLLDGGFRGPLFPVNPKYREVAGVAAYRRLGDLPAAADLAVVCTPPPAVAGILAELGARGTRAAVVLTAGLAQEKDAAGRPLREAILSAARSSGLRLLGPNCVGILAPHAGLNASFAPAGALPGRLAFVSQSGALCTATLDWARARGLGFSAFVSLGDSWDVDFGDVIDYLGSDAQTRAILLYLESVPAVRKFASALRAASRNKPVVAIKAGRAAAGQKAAASHTGALAGSDEVCDYLLRRAGALRVGSVQELFDAAETLQSVAPLGGDRLAILTNGGGPGVLATDALVAGGGRLADLSADSLQRLDAVLPATWSRANPVDIIGDALAQRYQDAFAILAADPGVDALLVLHAPTAVLPGTEAARAVAEAARRASCRVLSCWLGGESAAAARRVLTEAGIATYDTPENAVRAFLHVVQHRKAQELLMETPRAAAEPQPDAARGRAVAQRAVAEGRPWLTIPEAFELLAAFRIPVVPARAAASAAQAAAAAAEIGFPVALKLLSPDVLHKTEVGGVALDLDGPRAVHEAAAAMSARLARLRPGARLDGFLVQQMARRPGACELIAGAAVDPMIGPFLLFGQGGIAVEVIQDKAVAVPPLNLALAGEFMARTRVDRLLQGYRGRPPADREAVAGVLVRLSELIAEVPEVVELDVNPILADESGVIALDARIRVDLARGPGASRLAIRPYPGELEEEAVLPGGRRVLLRPIRPEDEPAHRRLFQSFSPEDVRFRFFHLIRELPHSELARYTQIDYDREMAFIAVDLGGPAAGAELGVVRAVCDPDNRVSEFAVIVASALKGQGLGRLLLDKMIRYLRERGTGELVGRVLLDNHLMLRLAKDLGFSARVDGAGPDVEIRLALQQGPAASSARTLTS